MECIKNQCRSPVACGGFGYCRELNMADGYVMVDAEELKRLRALDAKYGWTERPPPDTRHKYVPNRKYPWFCGKCGYAEHEKLKHL